MADIETLGTKSDSTIFQIAAIAFDIKTGDHISKFNRIANIEENDEMNVTGSTLVWWLNTNKELFTNLLNSGEGSSTKLLIDFQSWLMDLTNLGELYLWGNGILFDNKMIQHQLESIGIYYPIHYKNDRDLRTLVDLASAKLGVTEKELKQHFKDDSLVKHDAFDDVRYQINLAVSCYNLLTQ